MRTHVSILTTTLAIMLGLSGLALAQTPPPAQQEEKPAEAPVGVAGKWVMSIASPQGAMDVALEVKIDEKDQKTVTGTLNGPQGAAPIEGEYVDGQLGFLISFDTGGNGWFSIWFSGALKEDGTMAGTADMGEMGQMTWTAKRAK